MKETEKESAKCLQFREIYHHKIKLLCGYGRDTQTVSNLTQGGKAFQVEKLWKESPNRHN